ncbi:hypothetical protein [Bradyrhizobium sp.]|uniref:hypothetical protein n=1 Tax=Bradyrhizobium sp. TaxID=376 RepID=UPI001EC7AC79|nr:hypothetical protein [Bradyrhizobium sp.]MBV8918125.1 hypothetical protein [Bradyrhizobium sp.]MBV9981944.1 hypothetical protein [Bradyrhizobium sp.]
MGLPSPSPIARTKHRAICKDRTSRRSVLCGARQYRVSVVTIEMADERVDRGQRVNIEVRVRDLHREVFKLLSRDQRGRAESSLA